MILTKVLILGIVIGGINCASNESAEGDDRILHGTEAAFNAFPYHVSVQRRLEAMPVFGILGGFRKFCGGVIIHAKWVLTAANCFESDSDSDKIYVKAGSNNAFNYHAPSQLIHVKRIHMHPDFAMKPHIINDIALLELEKPFRWSSSVQKINLPDNSHVPQGEGKINGYGETNNEGNMTSLYLLEATVSATKNSDCAEFFKHEITKNQICIGYGAKENACPGDAGGPFIQTQYKKHVVVGISSFGNPGCFEYVPAVFTRVNAYLNFIKNTMQSNNFRRHFSFGKNY